VCVHWCCEYSSGPRAAARHKATTQLREVAGPSYNFFIFSGLQLDSVDGDDLTDFVSGSFQAGIGKPGTQNPDLEPGQV